MLLGLALTLVEEVKGSGEGVQGGLVFSGVQYGGDFPKQNSAGG